MAPVKNVHKVPQKQWRKWNDHERWVFNELYGSTMKNQHILGHPQMDKISPRFWKTLCWNFAWLASDAARDSRDRSPIMESGMVYKDVTKSGRVVRQQTVH